MRHSNEVFVGLRVLSDNCIIMDSQHFSYNHPMRVYMYIYMHDTNTMDIHVYTLDNNIYGVSIVV